MQDATWTRSPPTRPGYYLVRARPSQILGASDVAIRFPNPKMTYVDPASGRFDAGEFGGNVRSASWEWSGPLEAPDHIPVSLD